MKTTLNLETEGMVLEILKNEKNLKKDFLME
jgi:hypothetical protein